MCFLCPPLNTPLLVVPDDLNEERGRLVVQEVDVQILGQLFRKIFSFPSQDHTIFSYHMNRGRGSTPQSSFSNILLNVFRNSKEPFYPILIPNMW